LSVEFRNSMAQDFSAQVWWVSRWSPNKKPRLRAGWARADRSNLCSVRSSTSPDMETPQPLWGPHPSVWQLLHKKSFLSLKQNFLCINLCPLSIHWAPPSRAWFNLPYSLPSHTTYI